MKVLSEEQFKDTLLEIKGRYHIGEILYICDRTACPVCDPECYHTSNIEHAVNFKKQESQRNPGTYEYWEERE